MSSGFVSGGVSNPEDDQKTTPETTQRDSWAKAEEAIKYARWQQEEKESRGRSGEEKSLYEILQANKARKQEEFEEKLKFKNQFKPLDEDDVEYLDSIMSEQARTEQLRKQELASQLDQFRKAQYEAENAGNAESLENIPKVEDIVLGGWNVGGRKRKKPTANDGLKIRKMSDTSGVKPKKPTPKQPNNSDLEKVIGQLENGKTPDAVTPGSSKLEADTSAAISPANKSMMKEPVSSNPVAPTSGGLLGLVTYASDDDD